MKLVMEISLPQRMPKFSRLLPHQPREKEERILCHPFSSWHSEIVSVQYKRKTMKEQYLKTWRHSFDWSKKILWLKKQTHGEDKVQSFWFSDMMTWRMLGFPRAWEREEDDVLVSSRSGCPVRSHENLRCANFLFCNWISPFTSRGCRNPVFYLLSHSCR